MWQGIARLQAKLARNQQRCTANDRLAADVMDLQEGLETVEESPQRAATVAQ
jgi:hypothetical protein